MDQWIDKKGLRGVYENSSAIEKLNFKEKFKLDKRMKKESEIFPYCKFLAKILNICENLGFEETPPYADIQGKGLNWKWLELKTGLKWKLDLFDEAAEESSSQVFAMSPFFKWEKDGFTKFRSRILLQIFFVKSKLFVNREKGV